MPSLEESKPEVRKKKKGQRKQGYIIIRQEREPWGEKNLKNVNSRICIEMLQLSLETIQRITMVWTENSKVKMLE